MIDGERIDAQGVRDPVVERIDQCRYIRQLRAIDQPERGTVKSLIPRDDRIGGKREFGFNIVQSLVLRQRHLNTRFVRSPAARDDPAHEKQCQSEGNGTIFSYRLKSIGLYWKV